MPQTLSFAALHDNLVANSKPTLSYEVDSIVERQKVTVRGQVAVVHPDDEERFRAVVGSAGWKPVNVTPQERAT